MNLQKNHENTKEQLKISKIEICNDICLITYNFVVVNVTSYICQMN
jgi:hypothetical protein